jgi:uncharacterized membrane protein YfcA
VIKFVLIGFLVLLHAIYAVLLARDLSKNRAKLRAEPGRTGLIAAVSPVILFIATLGVSDFVMNTLFFKKFNLVEDRRLPGALITSAALPLGAVAVVYLLRAEVDITIVAVCMLCQAAGATVGVRLVAGFDGTMIKKVVGVAMLVSAVFLALRLFGVGGTHGTLTSFSTPKLVLCGVCALFLGVCNMMGMGAKAPYMSLLLTLGLSPDCVLPVVMTACTMSAVSGAIQYVQRDLFPRKITLIYSTVGFVGIALGFLLVTNLNQTVLQAVMLLITVYTGVTMLLTRRKKTAEAEAVNRR